MVRLAFAILLAGVALSTPVQASAGAQEPPKKVISIGLCTDQLALLMAKPGQLASVTYLSQQERAAIYPIPENMHINHGLVEEIYAMQPDLVIAGTYGARMTVAILRRLGVPVLEFGVADTLADLRAQIVQMAGALGVQASPYLTAMDNLGQAPAPQVKGMFYSANGYTPGPQSLATEAMGLAGIYNISQDWITSPMGRMDLEQVVIAQPDLVLIPKPYHGHSVAEQGLKHPALLKSQARVQETDLNKYWSCATPAVSHAIERLRAMGKLAEVQP